MTTISTIDQLEQTIGSPHPELAGKVIEVLDTYARAFIANSPFLILSTADSAGRVDASPKGDGPGFVEVLDDKTLVIPDRPGNKLAYGHRNILDNPQVGILFLIPNTPETLRINGRAELVDDAELLAQLSARGKPATLVTKVHVEECFFHCAKAFIRSGLWDPDSWGERHRVSFGEMYAARKAADAGVAQSIDDAVEIDYRENL